MENIVLSKEEERIYRIISKIKDGKSKLRAATKLGVSVRTVERKVKAYKKDGKKAFIHKNKGKPSKKKIPDDVRQQVVDLFKEYNEGTGILSVAHLREVLKTKGISIRETSLHAILRENDLVSKCATKATKAAMRKEIRERQKQAQNKEEKLHLENKIKELDRSVVHPARSKSKYAGELIQMDASEYMWFGGIKTHLHVAIDDSTNAIVGAYFDTQETLNGYYNVFSQILTNYGIPVKFLTDKRTVFEYRKKDSPIDKEYHTNFAYACSKLGVEIQTTSIAQAKGRVERLNYTLQLRIPTDFKIKGIQTISEANEYIVTYIKELCNRLNYDINSSDSVFDTEITSEEIDIYLSKVCERTINRGHIIQFNKKQYYPINDEGEKVFLKVGTKVLFLQTFNGTELISVDDKLYNLEILEEKAAVSENFDHEEIKPKEKKVYRPPLNHPWKSASYLAYLEKLNSKNEKSPI